MLAGGDEDVVDRPELLGLPVGNTKDSHRRRWEETKAKPFRAADTRKSHRASSSNRTPVAQGAGDNMNLVELQIEAHAIARDRGWYDTEVTFGNRIALIHSELMAGGAAMGCHRGSCLRKQLQ